MNSYKLYDLVCAEDLIFLTDYVWKKDKIYTVYKLTDSYMGVYLISLKSEFEDLVYEQHNFDKWSVSQQNYFIDISEIRDRKLRELL
jgi:hypothetical protein